MELVCTSQKRGTFAHHFQKREIPGRVLLVEYQKIEYVGRVPGRIPAIIGLYLPYSPSKEQPWIYHPMSFFCNWENSIPLSLFVKRSPNWSNELILTSSMLGGPICSQNQWYLIAECLDLGVIQHGSSFPKARAPMLSLWILICMLTFTCNCNSKVELSSFAISMNEKRLRQEELRATYLASIVDKVVSVCSLLLHRTRQLAKQMTQPVWLGTQCGLCLSSPVHKPAKSTSG